MGQTVQCNDEYDVGKLITFKTVPVWRRYVLRIMAPLYIPVIFASALFQRVKKSPLHDGKRNLTGIKKCAISDRFMFSEIKDTSRALKVTINDLMTSALAVAVKKYFIKHGDSNSDSINILIPANIRW
jgi:NRPS condensation-like uncharacterized protein